MRTIHRLLILIVGAAGLWLLASGVASADPATEACFTSKINSERAARGIPTLTVDSRLVTIARRHSKRMADEGTIFHNSNLANEAPPEWEALGENVGMGPDCGQIHQAFMNSPSHRANILDRDFNFVGVGVVIRDGTIYVTEVFMKASQPAPAPAPANPPPPPPPPPSSSAPPSTPAAPAPPPSPSPSPSPPPGSKVTGHTRALMEILQNEPYPTQQVREAYRKALATTQKEELARAQQEALERHRKRSFFAAVAAFVAAVLSGST